MLWKQEDHPRDGDGKFTDGNGSNPGKVKAALDRAGMNGLSRGHSGSIRPGESGKREDDFRVDLSTTNPEDFVNKLITAKNEIPLKRRWRVDVHDTADYRKDSIFVSDGGSCVAIEPNGNIISVCKKPGDRVNGYDLLAFAVKNGGDRLDAFGADLFDFYTRNGFEPVSWTPFNEEYAPFEWREARKKGLDVKKEPVIFYKYVGAPYNESYEEFLRKTPACEGDNGYDDAMSLRDKEINDVQK